MPENQQENVYDRNYTVRWMCAYDSVQMWIGRGEDVDDNSTKLVFPFGERHRRAKLVRCYVRLFLSESWNGADVEIMI